LSELDAESRAAASALAYRLRNRTDPDDDRFAREYVSALTERGWRPPPVSPDPGDADGDRWAALSRWATARTAGRDDWDPVALLGVMHGCRSAGVAYEDAEAVLWRVVRTGDDHRDFAELRGLARKASRKPEGVPATEEFRGALAALKARVTGPQPRLADDNDRRAS
jgi:hypothetical protein